MTARRAKRKAPGGSVARARLRAAAALAGLLALLPGCPKSGGHAPNRVPGVPVEAEWVGGADGGAWILCEDRAQRRLHCRVYHDFTGELEFDSDVVLNSGNGPTPRASELEFDGWDGQSIHLINGGSLHRRQ